MDLLWTLALVVGGYFVYNWYTGLQQQVNAGPDPDPRIPDSDPSDTEASSSATNYIDYEEVDGEPDND